MFARMKPLYSRTNGLWALALMLLIALLIYLPCSDPDPELEKQMTRDIELIQTLSADKKTDLTFNDIKPVLEKRCVVCHGCFDAPCQLKLSSMEGITRGANKLKVYDKKRYFWQQPTRLFVDAKTPLEWGNDDAAKPKPNDWRDKGFFSVLNEEGPQTEEENLKNSLLYKMLNLKKVNYQSEAAGGKLPDDLNERAPGMLPDDLDVSLEREQVCTTFDEFDQFARDHPLWGMPYALPNLSDGDYNLLVQWLAQGAKPSATKPLADKTIKQIKKWEEFFNKKGNKEQLVSRYIYEHLVLGHLYFKEDGAVQNTQERKFFRLVRSRTKEGEIDEIATIRPYDNPEGEFYYRLRPYTASIVDKDHIVYELSDIRMKRYEELFLLDPQGKVVASTFYENEGKTAATTEYGIPGTDSAAGSSSSGSSSSQSVSVAGTSGDTRMSFAR